MIWLLRVRLPYHTGAANPVQARKRLPRSPREACCLFDRPSFECDRLHGKPCVDVSIDGNFAECLAVRRYRNGATLADGSGSECESSGAQEAQSSALTEAACRPRVCRRSSETPREAR